MSHCAVPKKICKLPRKKGLEFPGDGGFCKAKNFDENVWSSIGISRGVGGVLRKNPFCGGRMDIFWNYTLHLSDTTFFKKQKV